MQGKGNMKAWLIFVAPLLVTLHMCLAQSKSFFVISNYVNVVKLWEHYYICFIHANQLYVHSGY